MKQLLFAAAFLLASCTSTPAAGDDTPAPTNPPATTTTQPEPSEPTEPVDYNSPEPLETYITTTTTTPPPAPEPEPPAPTPAPEPEPTPPPPPAPEASTGTGACGGHLPPCYIMERESGGNPHIYNQQGSGASGKWQFMPGTWNNYGGYPNAADAPEHVQDQFAAELWAGGAGCSHWSAC